MAQRGLLGLPLDILRLIRCYIDHDSACSLRRVRAQIAVLLYGFYVVLFSTRLMILRVSSLELITVISRVAVFGASFGSCEALRPSSRSWWSAACGWCTRREKVCDIMTDILLRSSLPLHEYIKEVTLPRRADRSCLDCLTNLEVLSAPSLRSVPDSLPFLRHLTIRYLPGDSLLKLEDAFTGNSFPALSSLSLDIGGPYSLPPFFPVLAPLPLVSLAVQISVTPCQELYLLTRLTRLDLTALRVMRDPIDLSPMTFLHSLNLSDFHENPWRAPESSTCLSHFSLTCSRPESRVFATGRRLLNRLPNSVTSFCTTLPSVFTANAHLLSQLVKLDLSRFPLHNPLAEIASPLLRTLLLPFYCEITSLLPLRQLSRLEYLATREACAPVISHIQSYGTLCSLSLALYPVLLPPQVTSLRLNMIEFNIRSVFAGLGVLTALRSLEIKGTWEISSDDSDWRTMSAALSRLTYLGLFWDMRSIPDVTSDAARRAFPGRLVIIEE